MDSASFIKMEHEVGEVVRIHIAHVRDPKMVVEFTPHYDNLGQIKGGTLKRVCAVNPWGPSLKHYAKIVRQAEKFFLNSLVADMPGGRMLK